MTARNRNPEKLLAKARTLAAKSHVGQTDKVGVVYLAHVADVAARVREQGVEIEAIAWLHDVVEDTDVTLDEIEAEFGPRIRAGVDAMTRFDDEDYFDDYLPRVLANPDAVQVKIADASHNWGKVHLLRARDPARAAKLDLKYPRVLKELGVDAPACTPIVFAQGEWRESA